MTNYAHFIPNGPVPVASAYGNRSFRWRGRPLVALLDGCRRALLAAVAVLGFVVSGVSAAAAPDPGAVQHRLDELTSVGAVTPVSFAAPDVLLHFYQQRGFALAWDDARAAAFIQIVRSAGTQGLTPADYLDAQLTALPPLSGLSGTARIDADAEFTEAFLRYAYDCRFGKVNPQQLDSSWNYARSVSNGGPYAALERILAAPDLAAQLAVEVGHGAVYNAVRVVLARYRGYAAAGGWKTLPAGATLKLGVVDPRVAALRARLAAEGFESATAGDPNTFDETLAKAVSAFQTRHGLGADGAVGAKTLDALNVPASALVDRLRVNLERLRWVLVQLTPRFVAVNIAGYRVYYTEDDRVRWTARAIVGKPYRATPTFRAEMTYLVVNPDWTVPPTILHEDSLPALRRDPSYLTQERMDVVDRNSGRVVDPSTIDWQHVTAKNFPYMLRQRPGPTNALGRIKFMFPNSHFVFLHDTPLRDLFNRNERAFSSGCIRVEHPFELANILLEGDPKWTPAALKRALDSEQTEKISLRRPVPVLIVYLTTVAFDGGRQYTFLNDIYHRDEAVLHALNAGFVYSPPSGL